MRLIEAVILDADAVDKDLWRVIANRTPHLVYPKYAAKHPEKVSVFGLCFDHVRQNPRTGEYKDGHRVMTSRLKAFDLDTMTITTKEGDVFKLEMANEDS